MTTPNSDQSLLLNVRHIIQTAPLVQPPTPMGDANVMLNVDARNRLIDLINAALPPDLRSS